MKTLLAAAATLTLAGAAVAQPYNAPPPGSYQRQCTDIRMEGQFLHARCRGAVSSINVLSCSTDIGIGPDGGLVCGGPGSAAAPRGPAYSPAPEYGRAPAYGQDPRYRDGQRYGQRGGYGRDAVTIFSGRNSRGPSLQVEGEVPNLDQLGLNDRVRSIRLGRRSGPWEICEHANFRGPCRTVTASISDTRRLGLEGISSLRPIY
ncbi:beta/gamma crystallin-related protein [Phenylobacterium sp.]|jgi:hypothetical protein|uniref:beta/gamma crystallin-related protein n=1 Tax=Phenylobacterium sp. TaxID=1871053 RepID=UPI002F92CAC5